MKKQCIHLMLKIVAHVKNIPNGLEKALCSAMTVNGAYEILKK